MKKAFKYFLVVLVVLLGVVLALPFFVDVNEYRPMIIEQIEEATGRDVDIGDIQLSVFPWVGVSLRDVRMGNASGFSQNDFARVDHVDVQIALMPLLNREVVVKRFVLDSPRLLLERNRNGVFNWQDLTAGKPVKARGKTTPSAPPAVKPPSASESTFKLASLTAEALNLRDGQIAWNDALVNAHFTVSQLNVEIRDVQLEKPVKFEFSARIEGEAVQLEGELGPISDLSRIDPKVLPLQAHLKSDALSLAAFKPYLPKSVSRYSDAQLALDVTLEQRPDQVRLSAGSMSLSGVQDIGVSWKVQMPKVSKLDIAEMILRVDGEDLAKISGNVHGIGGKLRYQFNASSGDIKRDMVVSWLPAIGRLYEQHPAPWNRMKINLSVAGSVHQTELRNVQVMLDEELVQVSGVVKYGGAPNLYLRLASNSLHLDPWLPAPGGTAPSPSKENVKRVEEKSAASPAAATLPEQSAAPAQKASASQEPDLRFLNGWKLSAEVKFDKLFMRDLELDNLAIMAEGNKGVFIIDPFRFDYGKGNLRNKTRLETKNYPVTWTASTNLTNIEINPILKTFADTSILHGLLKSDSRLSGKGLVEPNVTSHLNGTANATITDGKIEGIDIPGAIRRVTSFGKETGGPKSTDFSQLAGSFVITNGIVRNDDLFMASPVFRLTGNGIINLVNKTLDYHAKPKLVGTLVGQGDTVAARKGLAVPIHVTGPFSSPKLGLDVDIKSLMQDPQAIKETIRGARDTIRQLKQPLKGGAGGVREKIKKGLGGLLRKGM